MADDIEIVKSAIIKLETTLNHHIATVSESVAAQTKLIDAMSDMQSEMRLQQTEFMARVESLQIAEARAYDGLNKAHDGFARMHERIDSLGKRIDDVEKVAYSADKESAKNAIITGIFVAVLTSVLSYWAYYFFRV